MLNQFNACKGELLELARNQVRHLRSGAVIANILPAGRLWDTIGPSAIWTTILAVITQRTYRSRWRKTRIALHHQFRFSEVLRRSADILRYIRQTHQPCDRCLRKGWASQVCAEATRKSGSIGRVSDNCYSPDPISQIPLPVTEADCLLPFKHIHRCRHITRLINGHR